MVRAIQDRRGMSAGIRAQVDALIEEEDRSAEVSAGLVRVVAGAVLAAVVMLTTVTISPSAQVAAGHHRAGIFIIGGLISAGVVGMGLARSRFYRRELAYGFLALDAVLVGWFLHVNFEETGLPGDFAATFPVVWLPMLLLTVTVLRVRPHVQIFGLVAFAVAIVYVVLAHGTTDLAGRQVVAGQVARFFAPQPNVMRLAMLLLAGALLIVAAYRGRSLLVRALGEAEHRAALTRFLPAEVASLITGIASESLRRGRRQDAAIMFVDIRDSTAMAEHLDPVRLSVFVASFRRRVMRAAQQYGGVVDKFIGDGALIVFGLPEPRPDDAAHALACAKMLLQLIEQWNHKRQFNPTVRIGIGVHFGEVYFGVVGDEKRMELTVLGDAVNVAARLEQATKVFGTPLLASADAVGASGEVASWTEVGREPLRGRAGIVRMMRPG